MTDRELLIARYLPRFEAELRRIGFTDDDLGYLASGSAEVTEAALEAELADLRLVPSAIGAQAYFARLGEDFDAIKRDVRAREETELPPDDDAV